MTQHRAVPCFVSPIASMAACLAASDLDVTWDAALRWLETGRWYRGYGGIAKPDREPHRYLRMAEMAIDHMPYLDAERADRVTGLHFWLGAEAETA